jgi:hypothetical protein
MTGYHIGVIFYSDEDGGETWDVFYEKAPDVKAAKAAFLCWTESLGLSPSLLSALSGSPSVGLGA